MKNLDEAVLAISQAIGLDEEEIQRRKAFLELTEKDITLLQQVHDLLLQEEHGFTAAFYDHLLAFPAMRALLPDDATVVRLKHMQSAYFGSLTAGSYDADYIRHRLRVGVVHQRVGLKPNWYIGAYRKYLSELMPLLWRLMQDRREDFFPTYDALLKVVVLDMGLALDTYSHADRATILQHKNYAEQIINSMPAGLIVLDAAGKVRSMNPAMKKILGLHKDSVSGSTPLAHILPCPRLESAVSQVLSTGESQDNIPVTLQHKGVRHLEVNVTRTEMEGQQLLLLIAQDISFAVQARVKLQESEERFRLTFSQAAVGIAHIASDGQLVRVNRKLCDITGYTEEELLQRSFHDITHPDDLEGDIGLITQLREHQIQDYSREKRYVHKQGHSVWVNVTVSSMQDRAGKRRFISVVEDISRRKHAEDELLRQASHDTLTHLPNRLLLQDRLAQSIIHAHRARRHVAVMFIDLDRFKNINDSLGHDAGDEVIVEIGRRLAANVRDGDTVARQGGDEFVVVLSDIAKQQDVAAIAQKILDAMTEPMMLQGQELFPSGSIGISLYPRDGQDSQALLKNADTAMYRAKETGRNNFQFYAGEMSTRVRERLRLEGAMRRALERNEFVLHYQPQINIGTGEITGVEALLRWQPVGQPIIEPSDFIPVAEETGLIKQIGEWVLRTACAQHKAWREAGLPHLRVSVNLSARQFRQQDIAAVVARVLEDTGCGSGCLALELTESVLMDNPAAAAETLKELSAMGVHLAIDDFGTGYSSLSYLKRFPLHSLKIDRSFVRDLTTDSDDAAIVKSVIALAHSMKLTVIAEGVETEAQLEFLRRKECDQMQGYLLSRPLPAEELSAFLRARG